jgi:AcrR family transcriptional regulator
VPGPQDDGELAAPSRRRLGRGERRALVLQAALTVIARKGLDETQMVDIGAEAGMSAGHVMYYFPAKSELLMQALKWSEDRFLAQAQESVAALPTARDRLWRMVQLSVPEDKADPAWILWLETWARAPHQRRVARLQRGIEQRWTSALAKVIAQGQAAGEFRQLDAADFAIRLSALIDGLAIRALGGAGILTRKRLLSICAEYLEAELTPPRPEASRT